MTDLVIPNAFTSGTSIVASEVNANFDAVKTFVNTTGVPLLQDGVVATAKIANAAVTNAKLAADSVDTSQIKNAAVTTAKVADAAVTRPKIVESERIPTGVMMDYAGTTAPTGWLLCDGSAVSRSTYADLFTLIGSTFGAGDGSTTFNLPDLRGRVAVGLDNLDNSVGTGGGDAGRLGAANTLGGSGGSETHALTEAEIPDHTHKVNPPSTQSDTPSTTTAFLRGDSATTITVASQTHRHDVDIAEFNSGSATTAASPAVDGSAHNNMQPYLLVGKIIKV